MREFPDDFQDPLNDPEVYGRHAPVRRGSMRVPDIAEGQDWITLSDTHKKIDVEQYPERCRLRGQIKLDRLRKAMQDKLDHPKPVFVTIFAGTRIWLPKLRNNEA